MASSLLDIRNLHVQYRTKRGPVQAVRKVSFELRPQENLAIIGESGSGKSTLGLALVRLLPRSARFQAETMLYRGEASPLDLAILDAERLRRFRWKEMAIVFQAALSAFNPVMKVWDQFLDAAIAHDQTDRRAVRRRAEELLNYVQLDPRRVLDAYPHELSGGMRQRVLIAMALLLNPRVLILDEPTTALDILTQRNIIELLRRMKKELNLSMIFISHDLSLAAELADRVATMYAGEFVELGSVNQMFYSARHPYTHGLVHGVPRINAELGELSSIPGSPPDLIDLPGGCKFHVRCGYATEECRNSEPTLEAVPDEAGHLVSCFHWKELSK